MRKPKDHKGDLSKPKSAEKGVLGKRSLSQKTATSHKNATKTFKTQGNKRQKK